MLGKSEGGNYSNANIYLCNSTHHDGWCWESGLQVAEHYIPEVGLSI